MTGDSQISRSFQVRSKINDHYSVDFIDDLSSHLDNWADDKTAIFIIDEKINGLFPGIAERLTNDSKIIAITCNENNKTVEYAQHVIRMLIGCNVRKDSRLVAIGGGITQDIVAFISSILFRGVVWHFYPTTLLAQCDSCIGSKSSINFDGVKNLLGTFNPPKQIYIYPGFLDTLSESEIRSGIGEMLHYFFTEGVEIAEALGEQYDELLIYRKKLQYFIENSLRIKKSIIEIDEFDTSIRHIFNYGHTFGHAIEAVTNYAIPHGQAVSLGMDIANFISMKRNLLSPEGFNQMHVILEKNFPVFAITRDNLDAYCLALSKDKKNKGKMLGAIFSVQPGKVEKVFIEMDDKFSDALIEYSKQYGK